MHRTECTAEVDNLGQQSRGVCGAVAHVCGALGLEAIFCNGNIYLYIFHFVTSSLHKMNTKITSFPDFWNKFPTILDLKNFIVDVDGTHTIVSLEKLKNSKKYQC